MVGKTKQAISARVSNSGIVKTGEITTTSGGLQAVKLIPASLVFQWTIKDNPELALKMGECGATVFLHQMAGFKVESTAIAKPRLPQTYAEALRELLASVEENERLAAKIEKDAPLVSYAEAVRFSDDAVDFNSYAKMINTGRTRLFRKMRDAGVIMQNTTIPYQRWVDAGYFEVSQEVTPDGKLTPFALVTGKGQLWAYQRLDHFENLEQRAIAGIAQGVLNFSAI